MMVESVEMTGFGAVAANGSAMRGAGIAVASRHPVSREAEAPAASARVLPAQGVRRPAASVAERGRGRRLAGPVECPVSSPEAGYRMGRWERLGMTLVVVAAVVVGLVTFFQSGSVPTREVVVGPSDSMLSVVLREMPQMDPARAAELIETANGLGDASLTPGMVLSIPVLP